MHILAFHNIINKKIEKLSFLDKQMVIQTDVQSNRGTYRQTDIKRDGHTDRRTYRQTDIKRDGHTDRRT